MQTSALVRAEAAFDHLIRSNEAAAGSGSLLARCSHSLKEEEVAQYWDMGKCLGHRVRVALPPELLRLPRGSDLMVTFSTGGVATMAHNWVMALRRAGVSEGVVIGALDDAMLEACKERGLPCVPVKGDAKTVSELGKCKEKNIRKCPDQYPMMSTLKVSPPPPACALPYPPPSRAYLMGFGTPPSRSVSTGSCSHKASTSLRATPTPCSSTTRAS